MKAFITGSRAYGQPTSESDLDLVILVDEHTKSLLTTLSDSGKEPIRFGKLNIIACTSEEEFTVWKYGTLVLVHKRDESQKALPYNLDPFSIELLATESIDRFLAKSVMDSYRREAGIPIRETDSGDDL